DVAKPESAASRKISGALGRAIELSVYQLTIRGRRQFEHSFPSERCLDVPSEKGYQSFVIESFESAFIHDAFSSLCQKGNLTLWVSRGSTEEDGGVED